MKYLSAYCLVALSGKTDINESDLENVLTSVGIEADKTALKSVIAAIAGKNLSEVIRQGMPKLASVGGGASSSGASNGAAKVETRAEEKKEEKKEEEEEEDMD